MNFRPIDPKMPLAEIEHKQIEYWKRKGIFKKSLEIREGKPKYIFFDGPPFANGVAHYGHILGQSIKDAVVRYFAMKGYYVPRVNGWDCHGLPVEYEIEKELGLNGRQDIEKMGVEAFNTKCRESVFRYTEDWNGLFDRIGRFVDTENRYATLDANYMESIWWVVKQIWDKDQMYQGHKSMHICPRCVTPLSNFEVSLGYQDVTDLSATVKFRSKKDPNEYFLAWTTTPWTLPGNTALAVGENIRYAKVRYKEQILILAKDRLPEIFKDEEFTVEEELDGKALLGEEYDPLFDFYKGSEMEGIENAWKVIATDFVTTETGTGIVHIAGGFGEDDMKAVLDNKMPIISHVNMDGTFKEEVKPWAGKFVKGQDHNIAEHLEKEGLLFKKENIRHSYPHCWRCDTPLLNYATKSWFIRVSEIRDKLLKNNEKINWQPAHLKDGRFGKWLESARDWNISRNRFWGCPIPIWECETCDKQECIGSVEELKNRSGNLPMRDGELDLHKPYIDEITMPCECGGKMNRIPEVLDCWFESGAMPYAQLHYPFENKEEFENNFPAHFIAEGIDQTRGWFYTLHVLATLLFDKPAFQNVIVNGTLLGDDGEKLSKRKKNYPDPKILFEEKGVDSMRMFLFSSTATLGEDVKFSERSVDETVKKFTLTLWNTYAFFVTYAKIDGFQPQDKYPAATHPLDQWIISRLHTLIKEVTVQMDAYNLVRSTRPFYNFVDDLSNWYVRRSRRRFWKSENDEDKNHAYQTLYTGLVELSKLLAPFMPFMADEIYRNLTEKESVNLEDWPKHREELIDEDLNEEVGLARQIVNLGHALRAKKKIKVRQPLQKVRLALPKHYSEEKLFAQKDVILEELNVKELELVENPKEIAESRLELNARALGPKYGAKVQELIKTAREGKFEIKESGEVLLGEITLDVSEFTMNYVGREGEDVGSESGLVLALDTVLTPDLIQEGLMREVIRSIQDLRKEAAYEVSDHIQLFIKADGELEKAITKHADEIKEETLADELQQGGDLEWDIEKEVEIDGMKAVLALKRLKS